MDVLSKGLQLERMKRLVLCLEHPWRELLVKSLFDRNPELRLGLGSFPTRIGSKMWVLDDWEFLTGFFEGHHISTSSYPISREGLPKIPKVLPEVDVRDLLDPRVNLGVDPLVGPINPNSTVQDVLLKDWFGNLPGGLRFLRFLFGHRKLVDCSLRCAFEIICELVGNN